MEKLSSSIKTTASATFENVLKAGRQRLQNQRASTVPEVGIVNNFDPDQRTFLTAVMKGFSMVQKGSAVNVYNTLTVQVDYGVKALDRDFVVRPIPGQPVLVYPVAGQSGSANTSFIRSGGTEIKRYYPINYISRGLPGSVVKDI